MPRLRWVAIGSLAALGIGLLGWLPLSDSALYRLILRLDLDQASLKEMLRRWGSLAPLVFIVFQALQVVLAPIPGEVTGLLGGFVFGQWRGFLYSIAGLTAGSLLAFGVGRWLGARFVRRFVNRRIWDQLGFIVEAEGAILCFVIYLIPGLPKDLVCFLFGVSPMPFWVFAVASTLGRIPGTWALSAQGAKVASGQYLEMILVAAAVAAVAAPLYAYRTRIVSWVRSRRPPPPEAATGVTTERQRD